MNKTMYLINAKSNLLHSNIFYYARYSKEGIKNSTDKHIPTYEQHLNWYLKQDLNNMYLIYHNKYVGYVRIDSKGYISIAMCDEEHNKGYGTFALTKIVHKYNMLKATVNENNISSIKLFNKFPQIKLEIINEVFL